jgi:hypothetical protein
MTSATRPSERALWHAVVETLRDAVLPHVGDAYAVLQTERLIGMATYARDRGDDPTPHRDHAIAALIGDDDPLAVLTDAADPRRERLRALLVAHLGLDLTTERVLLEHFGDPAVLDVAPVP